MVHVYLDLYFDFTCTYFDFNLCKSFYFVLKEKIRALQKHLAVNTTSLSSYIRAKTSAQDNRPSAVSIGALGAGLLIAVFGLVLIIDSTILFKDLRMLTRNIRGFFTD